MYKWTRSVLRLNCWCSWSRRYRFLYLMVQRIMTWSSLWNRLFTVFLIVNVSFTSFIDKSSQNNLLSNSKSSNHYSGDPNTVTIWITNTWIPESSEYWTVRVSSTQIVNSRDLADHLNTGHFEPFTGFFQLGFQTTIQIPGYLLATGHKFTNLNNRLVRYSDGYCTGHLNNRTIWIADKKKSGNRMPVIWMAVRYSDAIWIADRYSDHHLKREQFFVRYSDAIWITDHSTIGQVWTIQIAD